MTRPREISVALRAVLLTCALALALRVFLVLRLPDADMDVYGHLAAARAVLTRPADPSIHWVWLPGWHWTLALILRAGGGLLGARLFDAVLASVGPLLLFLLLRERRSDHAATVSAIAWCLSPLAMILGTSAQPETSFAVLVVGAALALKHDRGIVAGALLSAACLERYEGWAAVAGLLLSASVTRRARRTTLVACIVPVVVLACWAAMRGGGDVVASLIETRRFAGGGIAPLGLLVYTIIVPLKLFGPLAALLPRGVREAARAAPALAWASLAILLFVTGAAFLGGSFGLDRHYAAVVPFACACLGFAIPRPSSLSAAALPVLSIVLAVHLAIFVHNTRARWRAPLAAAAWLDTNAKPDEDTLVCWDLALCLATRVPEDRIRNDLPEEGRALVLGWDKHLGALGARGRLLQRFPQDDDAVVVREVVVDRQRASAY
jgi:hypothetical protein